MTYPKVSIIILNWNGWKDTIECLESLFNIKYNNFEIVLVDNNSKDESVDKIIEWAKNNKKIILTVDRIKLNSNKYVSSKKSFDKKPSGSKLILLMNEENFGFAKGNNVAMQQVVKENTSRYILLLNNDTVVDKNILNELIKTSIKKKLKVVGPDIRNYYFPDKPQIKQFGNIKTLKKVETLSGACILVSTDVLDKIGYLDTTFYLYYEDQDFCEKAKISNISVWYLPTKNKVFHKIGMSSKKVKGLQFYYMTRNVFLIVRRYRFNLCGLFYLINTLARSFVNEIIIKKNINVVIPFVNGIYRGLILFVKNPNSKYY